MADATTQATPAGDHTQRLTTDDAISMVSHELRIPLTSIKEGIALLLEEALGAINPEQRDFLTTISNDIERLDALINDLLDVSKIEAGKMTLIRQFVHVPELIEQICRSYQVMAGRRTILKPSPAAGSLPPVFVDRHRILQVLGNLLSNAIKFTPEDGTITFGLSAQNGGVDIWVADNGQGIPQEALGRLFRKFEQANRSPSERPRGTGLGLVICKQLVELHRGGITVTSKPNQGTTFTVTLPAHTSLTALQELVEETAVSAAVETGSFACLSTAAPWQVPAQGLEELEELVRRGLRKADRVLATEELGVVILAVSDRHGMGVLRQRFQQILAGWQQKWVGPSGESPAAVLGGALYPDDGRDVPTLLAKARANAQRLTQEQPTTTHQALPSRPSPKILLVDDEPSLVKMIGHRLQLEGVDVVTAVDGVQALDAAKAHRPHLIILDLMLPKLDGFEVCRRLKQDSVLRHIPIVMLTAKAGTQDEQRGLECGANAYLRKPFNAQELLKTMWALLDPAPHAQEPTL
jgi:CheY-like chemotaxis protein/two-component sensor histidine kinase